jgi:hypothetical protein
MHARIFAALALAAAAFTAAGAHAGADPYPRTIVAEARATTGVTAITSKLTIRLDRLMEPSRHTRVLDGLKYNGYQGFMNALRPLPVIGQIATQNRDVAIRYAWESPVEDRTRLILCADKPLFFLAEDAAAQPRKGYELTVVELIFDGRGAATGTMSGAARVKPAGDGIVLEDFAIAPVELTVAVPK